VGALISRKSGPEKRRMMVAMEQPLEQLEREAGVGIGSEVTDAIARWAATNPYIRRVWVYGSRAKGTHRPDSDIDIAVELEPVADSEEALTVWMAHAGAWRWQLQSGISPKVDLEWFDPDGTTRVVEAGLDEAKVLIYERAA